MLEILQAGFLTTVQDSGRIGWARYGVPPSGPLDGDALRAANQLVGNARGAAGLEITLVGPVLRCWRNALVAICGAEFELWAGTRPVPTWHALFLRAGELLRFGKRISGARAYFAIRGGITTSPFLDSRSTYLPGGFGGLEGRALRVGDRLPVGAGLPHPAAQAGRVWPREQRPAYCPEPTLRVILGPQADCFTAEGRETFLSSSYELSSDSNRMGARLVGPVIESCTDRSLVSDGIVSGSVQVPPAGQPIVMLADHQTTGGYPKIATVIQADLPLMAQCLPGDRVRFRAVELEELE